MKGLQRLFLGILMGAAVSAYGESLPDVGMVGEEPAAATSSAQPIGYSKGLFGETPDDTQPTASGSRDFFLHVGAGQFFRNMQKDSGFYCLNGFDTGEPCASSPSFKDGRGGFVWSAGLGVRYNQYFALNFTYWGLHKQSVRSLNSPSHLTVNTWLVTALYEAKILLFAKLYVVPSIGVAYEHNKTTGVNSSRTVQATRTNWRPAFGVSLLYDLSDRWAIRLSGVAATAAGNAPTLKIDYPGVMFATFGVAYTF